MHHCTCTFSWLKWRSYWDSPSEGLISYMWIQSDSDLTSLIKFQGVCVTRLMCSPLAGNFPSTPVLVHKGLIHGVMTSLPWQTGLQSQQSCTIALAHSVGYKWRFHQDSPSEGLISYMWIQSDSDLTSLINFQGVYGVYSSNNGHAPTKDKERAVVIPRYTKLP